MRCRRPNLCQLACEDEFAFIAGKKNGAAVGDISIIPRSASRTYIEHPRVLVQGDTPDTPRDTGGMMTGHHIDAHLPAALRRRGEPPREEPR